MNENKDNKNVEEISQTTNDKEENSNVPVGVKRIRKIAIFSEYEQDKPSEQENTQTSSENATTNTENNLPKRERKKVKHFDEKEENQEGLHLSQGTPSSLPKKSPSKKTSTKSNKQTNNSESNLQTTTSISPITLITSSIPSISSTSLSILETLTFTNPEQIEMSLCKVLSEQKRELEEKLRAINSDLEKINSKIKEKEALNAQTKNRKKITIKMSDSPPKETDAMVLSEELSPVTPKPSSTKSKKNKSSSKKKSTNKQETTATPNSSKRERSKRKQEEPVESTVNLSPILTECQKVLNSLIRHKYSFPFLTPVDPVALNIPDYFKIIEHPMDLGTIKKKLLAGDYSNGEEFSKDVFLVFDNACTYNHPGSDVYIMSETLRDFFVRKFPSIKKEKQISADHNVNNNAINNTIEINNTIQKSVNNINEDIKMKDKKKTNNNLNTTLTIDNKNNNENFVATTDIQKENNIIIIKKKPAKVIEEVEWTREDKLRLGASIGKLNEKNLRDVFQIIKNSTYVDANEKEVVFDLDALEPRTLRELDQYISKVNSKKKSTKKTTRQLPSSASSSNLPSFPSHSSLTSSSHVHSSASLPTSPILSPTNLHANTSDHDLSLSGQSEEEKKSSILPEDIPMIVKPAAHTKIEIENVSWMSLGSEKENNVEEIRTSSESLWSEFQNKDFLNKQKEKERREREERLRKEREEKEEERRREEQRLLKEKENEQLRLELEKEEARKRVEKELEELRQKEIEERERAKQKTSVEEEEEDIEQFVGSMEFNNLGLQSISFNRSN